MPNTLGKTEICNIALRRIGVRPVNNVDSDTSTAATEIKAVWDLAVQAVLRVQEWNFATKVTPLAELSNESVLGWDHIYIYPADCAIIWSVEDAVSIRSASVQHKWKALLSPDTNTPVIATDVDGAYAKYTAVVTDPTKWDSVYVDALAWRLAYDVCQRLVSNSSMFQKCAAMYSQAIASAQTMNKVEDGDDEENLGAFINVR